MGFGQAGHRQRSLVLCMLLAALSLSAYLPLRHNGFINCDDPDYVSENPVVQNKLTINGVKWAFDAPHVANYHPITWLSHMLDTTLFGVNPGPHHLMSLELHVLNSVLLFLLLQKITGRPWPSMLVAGLFAVHPQHVESVAWIAERKDVLSGLFWILTIWAYAVYAQKPGFFRYLLVLLLLGLGLLSKPMTVTLPCVLLLLDFWPLRRTKLIEPSFERPMRQWNVFVLFAEKLPMLAMSAGLSAITYLAQSQGGAMGASDSIPWAQRINNAAVAYARYIEKFFWPTRLAVFYPSMAWPIAYVAAAAAGLVAISIVVFAMSRKRPYLLVGWLWFIGTLVPVIGLLQVGSQSMADRYMYIPMIGLAIAVVWALAEMFDGLQIWNRLAAVCVLIACAYVTSVNVRYWKDSETLFSRALDVTEDNAFSRQNLGSALAMSDKPEEAIPQYRRAVELQPDMADPHRGLGFALRIAKRYDEAAAELRIANKLNPNDPRAACQLGHVYAETNQWAKADRAFSRALEVDPTFLDARLNLAAVKFNLNDHPAAGEQLRLALQIDPSRFQARYLYGTILLEQNKPQLAAEQFAYAVQLNRSSLDANLKLANSLIACGRSDRAITPLLNAVKLDPNQPEALQELAWILATHPDKSIRNGAEAVFLASRADQITQNKSPEALDALAAALAESGDFEKAERTAEQALQLANETKKPSLATHIVWRVAQYRAKAAFRDTTLVAGTDQGEVLR